MHIRDYIELLIGEESAKEFAEFAWGKDFRKVLVNGIEGMNKWNELHGDKLLLQPQNLIDNDIVRMISFWQETKNLNKMHSR